MKLVFVFCGLVLLTGCYCFPQRSTLRDVDELDIECSFDDNELAADTIHFGTVTSDDAYVWKNGEISYYFNFHENIRSKRENKKLIQRAMEQIENRSCFRFLEMDSEPVRKHHLEIKIGEPSCRGKGFHALVRKAGPFKLRLYSEYQLADSPACINWQDGILHELMHVLGVMHTQKRKDRDQHIIINEENIKDEHKAKYQYEVCEGCNSHGVPYDCSSIMHYGTRTFGAPNGKDTMTPIDPSTCQLTKVGSAFDGRGPTKTDWQLLDLVSKKVCSGPPANSTPSPVGPEIPTKKTTPTPATNRPTKTTRSPTVPRADCLTHGGPDVGTACVFPFIFNGKTYNECTFDSSDDGISSWCSTKTDGNDNHIKGGGHYGYCRYPCPIKYSDAYGPTNTTGYPTAPKADCLTHGGPDDGSACVFPFIFDGKTYNECTFDSSDNGISPWCSTKTDGSDNHIKDGGHYGYCHYPCPIKYSDVDETYDWTYPDYDSHTSPNSESGDGFFGHVCRHCK